MALGLQNIWLTRFLSWVLVVMLLSSGPKAFHFPIARETTTHGCFLGRASCACVCSSCLRWCHFWKRRVAFTFFLPCILPPFSKICFCLLASSPKAFHLPPTSERGWLAFFFFPAFCPPFRRYVFCLPASGPKVFHLPPWTLPLFCLFSSIPNGISVFLPQPCSLATTCFLATGNQSLLLVFRDKEGMHTNIATKIENLLSVSCRKLFLL